MTNLWTKYLSDGVEVVEHDGYEIELDELRRNPEFFLAHVAEKAWADPPIVDDLRVWAALT